MQQYYIQREASGYVGNCLLWWRKGHGGYTCDISDAQVFDDNDPKFLSAMNDSKYRAWKKESVDSAASLHVDHQKLNWRDSFGGGK